MFPLRYQENRFHHLVCSLLKTTVQDKCIHNCIIVCLSSRQWSCDCLGLVLQTLLPHPQPALSFHSNIPHNAPGKMSLYTGACKHRECDLSAYSLSFSTCSFSFSLSLSLSLSQVEEHLKPLKGV